MAVASPYAVFRAADLAWPAATPPLNAATAKAGDAVRSRPTAARLVTLIQGELFPSQALA